MMKKEKRSMLLSCLPGSLLLAGMPAFATTVYYEPFDYDAGDLSTETASVWSDTGSIIESGSSTYGTLATSGNKVTMSDDTSWADTGTTFDGLLDDGDTLWFSVVINTISGSNPDFGFALASAQGVDTNNIPLVAGAQGLGFRIKGGLRATAWNNAASSSSGVGYASGTTILVVGQMIFGATDTVNIYTPDTNLNLGAVVQTQTASLDQTLFDTITFMNKGSNPRAQTDEIRFGTSSADVLVAIPEPSSIALLSLAGLGLLRRRR